MKGGAIWIALTCFLVTSLVLASCATKTTTSTTASTTTSKTTNTTITTTKTITTTSATTATTVATGNWWDSLGTPQYGGTLTTAISTNVTCWDPWVGGGLITVTDMYLQRLYTLDWTLDPAVYDYKLRILPNDYTAGQLAESWEFTDPGTYVVHIRKGIYWQNKPPANGREFTADDVAFDFNRMLGLGGYGFNASNASPYVLATTAYKPMTSVTATDKYTVVFKWNGTNPMFIVDNFQVCSVTWGIVCPDVVKLYGNTQDWHNTIGTGPFMPVDFVSDSSVTFIKNPNYWEYDERYPQNKLPYIDKVTILIIPDPSTKIAALRTGKIDAVDNMTLQQSQSLHKMNPDILLITIPKANTDTIDPRNDVAPFNDIRVRIAMQKSIDLATIAATYYQGTADPNPSSLVSKYFTGWGFPYSEWPQALKDEYAYDPTAAKKLLADAGYPNGFKTNIVIDNSSDMNLIQIVASYFTAVGINVEIRPMDTASWLTFVRTNHKNDQLAERSSGVLGLTNPPSIDFGQFLPGSSGNWAMVNDPTYNAFNTQAVAATTVDEEKQILRACSEYVTRQHYVISLLFPPFYGACQPWFKGYDGQYIAVEGTGYCSTVLSHSWIDQTLKKSMGY